MTASSPAPLGVNSYHMVFVSSKIDSNMQSAAVHKTCVKVINLGLKNCLTALLLKQKIPSKYGHHV